MGVRSFRPTSPGRRFMTVSDFAEVTKSTPEKSLLAPVHNKGGRNNNGRITTRHQGGGHKRRYRIIDFKRLKDGVPAKVAAVEYDPNRSSRIALLTYAWDCSSWTSRADRQPADTLVESPALARSGASCGRCCGRPPGAASRPGPTPALARPGWTSARSAS